MAQQTKEAPDSVGNIYNGIDNVRLSLKIRATIEHHWESMPKQAKIFLLETLDRVSFHTLARFWSSNAVIEYPRGGIAGTMSLALSYSSWFLALNYLKLGQVAEARALTLNGSFLHQCFETSIEHIIEICGSYFNRPYEHCMVPYFSKGLHSMQTPHTMKAFLLESLPEKYHHTFDSFKYMTSPDNMKNYIGQIGDDWNDSSRKSCHQPHSQTEGVDETQIQLILVDDMNKDEEHAFSFSIGSSTTLKTLFNDYAEKRGVSLRSLRFSYNGKTLFLSSVGNKSPDELNMQDQDIINVHDTSTSQETSTCGSSQNNTSAFKKAKAARKTFKRAKGKGKKKQNKKETHVKTLEEYRAQHSKLLSKLHEELEPQLKGVRSRLNDLDLERQPQKKKEKKRKKKRNTEASIHVDAQNLPNPGVGGKAGKPYFTVQVGEVQNLYKTTKPSLLSISTQHRSHNASTLDLHGHTREEALDKLDETVKVWIDMAMQGCYPFVIPAVIVCGCGNQILSETVEKWIRSTQNVCNAPKNSIPRNKFSH